MSTDNPQPITESSLLHFIDHLCPAIPEPIEEAPAIQTEEQPTIPLPTIVPVTRAQLPPWSPTDHRRQRGLRDALITLGIQAICIVFFTVRWRQK